MFSPGPGRTIAEAVFEDAAQHGAVEAARVLGRLEDPVARELASRLLGRIHDEKDYDGELAGADRLVGGARGRRKQEIKQEIRLAKDRETHARLLAEYRQLMAEDAPKGATAGP